MRLTVWFEEGNFYSVESISEFTLSAVDPTTILRVIFGDLAFEFRGEERPKSHVLVDYSGLIADGKRKAYILGTNMRDLAFFPDGFFASVPLGCDRREWQAATDVLFPET